MSGIAEIKHRIESVRDTKKITNAMYLIASTKVRRAKNDLERTRPYFTALRKEIASAFSSGEEITSIYFHPEAREITCKKDGSGILVITADKGLAGAYNQNVLKKARVLLEEHPDNRMFVVGEYGRQYFKNHGVPFDEDFRYTAQDPTLHRAREICDILLPKYESGELDEIYIVYTDFVGGRTEEVYTARLLPLESEHFQGGNGGAHFEYEPSAEKVIAGVIATSAALFTARWWTAIAANRTRVCSPCSARTTTRRRSWRSFLWSITARDRRLSRRRSPRSPRAREP